MEKASGKNNKWLWLIVGLVVIAVIAVVFCAKSFGGNDKNDPDDSGTISTEQVMQQPRVDKVYWRTKKYLDSVNNTTLRVPDENGVYTAQFYCDGETVDVKFKDKTLVETIDSLTNATCHFGFVFDGEGYAEEVISSAEASSTLLQCERYDITEINEDGSYKAAEIINLDKCNRCGGKGYIQQFNHVEDGICFSCWGTGYKTFYMRVYSRAEIIRFMTTKIQEQK